MNETNSGVETFHGIFPGAAGTVKIDFSRITEHTHPLHGLTIEWTHRPTRHVVPLYVEWMHSVLGEVAKRTKQSFLYAYPPGGEFGPDVFLYRPDGSHEHIFPTPKQESLCNTKPRKRPSDDSYTPTDPQPPLKECPS